MDTSITARLNELATETAQAESLITGLSEALDEAHAELDRRDRVIARLQRLLRRRGLATPHFMSEFVNTEP